MIDALYRGTLAEGQVRWFLISSKQMVEAARQIHHTTPTATAAMGRVLMAAALMSAGLKDQEDRLTLTFAGNGPAGRILAVGRANGHIKAYMDHPEADLPPRERDHKLDVGALVGHEGTLTVTRDIGLKEPYVGQTPLVNGEIAQDLTMYYMSSEQQPSLISLGVLVNEDGSVQSAGGLMVQPLPGCSDEVLDQLELRSLIYADISAHMDAETDMESVIRLFFTGLSPEILQKGTAVFQCDCSRERIEKVLISLGRHELEQMIEEDHQAEVTCHFCHAHYHFDEEALRGLLNEATGERIG